MLRRFFILVFLLVLVSCATPPAPTVDQPDNPKTDGSGQTPATEPVPQFIVTISSPDFLLAQQGTKTLEAEVKDSSGTPVTATVTWVSSHPEIASVDSNGIVTALALGEATITASANGVSSNTVSVTVANLWSDPKTWESGQVPGDNAEVVIPQDKTVILDVTPPALNNLTILGTLVFAEQNLDLTTGWIMVHGALKIGSEFEPFTHKAILTLTADNIDEDVMGMGTRGILLMGGRLELYGATPNLTWTKLNASAATGAISLTLKDSVDWKKDDEVVIAPTDFFPHNSLNNPAPTFVSTEKTKVSAVNGLSLTITDSLQKARWGMLQYVNDSGLTLTPTTSVTPLVLDERAAVGNLTRNIVIQGAKDTLWDNEGFGAQIMAMHGAVLKLDGVEMRRMGQLGRERRYPIHWHMLSYNEDTGAELGDATGQFVRNSSVHTSKNRCVVIHGTNGVTFSNNICYDITGHAVFLEDAVERRNIIENNLVLKVRDVPATKRFLEHDDTASGFWLTNPDNIVRGNLAADAEGKGFWLAFPKQTLGLSSKVSFRPDRTPFGIFEDNTAHSSIEGIHFDNVPTKADSGKTEGNKYIPMQVGYNQSVEVDYNTKNWLRFRLERVTVFKNGTNWGNGAFWNRVSWPDYVNWVSADNTGAFFAGAGDNGRITESLIIGSSLNDSPSPNKNLPLVALASYHSTFDMDNNVIVNFPFLAKHPGSGAFKTDDYYITAVDKGLVRNPDNRLINSHPGYRVLPPALRTDDNPNDNWTLAGALWDPHGYWGPKGNFWVYDVPFLTSGATCIQVQPAGQNGSSCDGEYYGVGDYLTDFDTNRYNFRAPLEVIRQDNAGNEIGRWTVADGNVSNMLGNMRHFAAYTGGNYIVRFPKRTGSGYDLPKRFEASISNAYRVDDWFMLGMSFDGSVTPSSVTLTSNSNVKRTMRAALSLADVVASQGDKYWQDTAQNVLWVKIVGGLPSDAGEENSDTYLYRSMRLVVLSQ